MGNTPTVGHYHFDGWDLPTKYGWMHSGAGSQAAAEVADIVHRMAVVGFAGARAAGLH
ncbi:MAG: hypothetical protein ACRDTD_18245 [Pseudonocardiaceae bacterium]